MSRLSYEPGLVYRSTRQPSGRGLCFMRVEAILARRKIEITTYNPESEQRPTVRRTVERGSMDVYRFEVCPIQEEPSALMSEKGQRLWNQVHAKLAEGQVSPGATAEAQSIAGTCSGGRPTAMAVPIEGLLIDAIARAAMDLVDVGTDGRNHGGTDAIKAFKIGQSLNALGALLVSRSKALAFNDTKAIAIQGGAE